MARCRCDNSDDVWCFVCRCFVTESMSRCVPTNENPNMKDHRKRGLHDDHGAEGKWKGKVTAGVPGRPGFDCSHNACIYAAKRMEYENVFTRE